MTIPLGKLKAPPAYQVVSEALQRLILAGALKPGDPLPPEVELAGRFGVNRSTMREGIRALESAGLVGREGRKRLVVTVPRHADLAPGLSRAMIMQEVTFREVWQVANTLEPLVAELAAAKADAADIAALAANVAAMAERVADGRSPAALDLEFHTLLAEATGNRVLLLAREPIGLLLFSTFETIRPEIPQAALRNLEAHQSILAAVEARDAMVAREWMQKHMRDLMRGWLLGGHGMDSRIDPALTF